MWHEVTYTVLIIRFHIHPWNGTLTLLDVCSTSAGIPPRKSRCRFTDWSLGSAASLLASSSTWTAKDLRGTKKKRHSRVWKHCCTALLETQTSTQPARKPLYTQWVFSSIIQYTLIKSPDHAAWAVAARKHQDLQAAFVQHHGKVGLQKEIKKKSVSKMNDGVGAY